MRRPRRARCGHCHRNPLDAQALYTQIQKWPRRSGDGIFVWK